MASKSNKYRPKLGRLRRRSRWVLWCFVVCLVFAGLSILFMGAYRALLNSPVLRVSRINVSGCKILEAQTLIRQAEIPAGVNILSLDLNEVHQRVMSHPWVAAAVIIREIPDRVRIQIEERQPVALVRGHEFYLMDIQGVCFSRARPGDYPGLPIISGLAADSVGPGRSLPEECTALLQSFRRECQGRLPWRLISEINCDKQFGLRFFTHDGGIRVDLGSRDYGLRMARLEKVLRYLEGKGAQSHIRGIDISHGDRVFVSGDFQLLQQDRLEQKGV